jgi:transposase-like protein
MGRKPKKRRRVQRQIVRQLLRGEESCAAVARKYRVSDQTLYRWQREFLANNEDPLPADARDSDVSAVQGDETRAYECRLDSFLRQCPVCGSNMTVDYMARSINIATLLLTQNDTYATKRPP